MALAVRSEITSFAASRGCRPWSTSVATCRRAPGGRVPPWAEGMPRSTAGKATHALSPCEAPAVPGCPPCPERNPQPRAPAAAVAASVGPPRRRSTPRDEDEPGLDETVVAPASVVTPVSGRRLRDQAFPRGSHPQPARSVAELSRTVSGPSDLRDASLCPMVDRHLVRSGDRREKGTTRPAHPEPSLRQVAGVAERPAGSPQQIQKDHIGGQTARPSDQRPSRCAGGVPIAPTRETVRHARDRRTRRTERPYLEART